MATTIGTQLNTAGTPISVPKGGTGVNTMTTAYAPVCAGTTATGNLQVASTGLSTSGFVLTSNGASAVPSFQAVPGSGILSTSVTLTRAQIVAAHTTPVQLIAAQGANTVIVVLNLVFKLVVAGTAYALTGNSLCFGYGTSSTTIPSNCAAMPISNAGFAGATNTTLYFSCSNFTGNVSSGVTSDPISGNSLSTTPVNADVTFTSKTNNPTGGTSSGDSTVFITYMVVTVA